MQITSLKSLKQELSSLANPTQAKLLQRFFKTGKGEYGEGDIFLGIKVPEQRKLAKKYSSFSLAEIKELIYSKIHEERLIGFLILTYKYPKSSNEDKEQIFNFCIQHSKQMNNWDLVDLTAPKIIGEFLINKEEERKILYTFAHSENLWQRRISIISTFTFIRQKQFQDSLVLAELLLNDKHDLIHKAVGWMLREVGKKDLSLLESFLNKHCTHMPRTMLRYSIEKLPEEKRKAYLHKS